jgi:hypothetical protein
MTLFCLSAVTHAQLSHQFTNTARTIHYGSAKGVAVASDGTVFLANRSDGLRAYIYDGTSFFNTAHIYDGSWAEGVAVASDGTVFLANGSDGLRAYTYDGTSFTKTAHIYDGSWAEEVAVASDGTVFLSDFYEGMFAYTYSPASGIENKFSVLPDKHSLSQNYPNPFNPKTTIRYELPVSSEVELTIYNSFGQKVVTLVRGRQNAGVYKYEWDATGYSSGLYFCKLQTKNGFVKTRKFLLMK